MMARMMSLAVTPGGSLPSTSTRMFLAFFWISVWVASTCSTSDVPMPWASAPKAPCVEVWLSPQTMVVPGSVKPCSGPTTWTMPWRLSSSLKYSMPNSLAFLRQRLDLDAAFRIGDALLAVGGRHVVVDDGERLLRARAPCGRSCAGPRRPAGSSPRGRDGGRYRAGRCRPAARRPDGRPRSCRRACAAWPSSSPYLPPHPEVRAKRASKDERPNS